MPTPPADAHLDRRAVAPNAVLGDGAALLTLSARGEVEQLWWPHVDHDPNLAELRLGVLVDDRLTWLDDPSLRHRQRYDGDADVLVTEVAGDGVGRVVLTDVVVPARRGPSVLVRHVAGLSGRLVAYVRPTLGGTAAQGGAYLDPVTGALVCHRRDRVLALGLDVPATGELGERHRGPSALAAVATGRLRGGGVVHGEVDGVLVADAAHAEVTVAVVAAHDRHVAAEVVATSLAAGAAQAQDARRAEDAATLTSAPAPLVEGDAGRIYRRSLLAFRAVSDRATGGVLAAPEADPGFARSGGYGFVWARDLAFILLAHVAAERRELAHGALGWLQSAQGADGLWLQRNWADGSLAPSWGTQLDETGAVLVAYEAACVAFDDPAWDERLWPSASRAADALVAVLDPRTGLPAPSMDLWEERVGLHAYTAAATCAGLRAAASLADRRAERDAAQRWREGADRVAAGIDAHLWSPGHGRFLRSVEVARDDDAGAPVTGAYDLLPTHPAVPPRSLDPVDATVDVSLLGLAYPFGVVAADDPRMVATIDAIEARLRAPDGGLRRYEGDPYEGGNPWVLTTLWLGLARRAPGEAVAADEVHYAVHAATSTGLLPEQVDERTGEPAWIVPLTWSHAMLVLALRPDPAGLPTAGTVRAT
ncbi:hypothetical protein FTX61_11070 [Nitriliruptoraceae bacterium ZYF776]|nr:hypothetical protein [Profundirhabdus halotolerans]